MAQFFYINFSVIPVFTLVYVGTFKNRRVSVAGLTAIIKFPSRSVLRAVRSLKAESPMGGKEVNAEHNPVGEVVSLRLSYAQITYNYHCILL